VGGESIWVGPPEKLLAISPAPTPATCQVYKILWDKSITLYANHENKYIDRSLNMGYSGTLFNFMKGII